MRYPRRFLNVVILLALLIILAAKLPGSLGAQDIAITDQNMAPAYAAGDMVFLREEAFERVKVGDVVVSAAQMAARIVWAG